jgi:hypothetical protein
MTDIFLYPSEVLPRDIKLSDPTVLRDGSPPEPPDHTRILRAAVVSHARRLRAIRVIR